MDKPAENATDEVGEEEIAGGGGDKKKRCKIQCWS